MSLKNVFNHKLTLTVLSGSIGPKLVERQLVRVEFKNEDYLNSSQTCYHCLHYVYLPCHHKLCINKQLVLKFYQLRILPRVGAE